MSLAPSTAGAEAEADEEASRPYYLLESELPATLGPVAMARWLAGAIPQVISLIRAAAPGSAVLLAVLQVLSGAASSFGLLSTAQVLAALFAQGPTNDRLRAALPSLVLVAAAYTVLGLLSTAVTFAQARIAPSVLRVAEGRLVAASLAVSLASHDDAAFTERILRARDRGLLNCEMGVVSLLEVTGSLVAVAAAAFAVGVLHPMLVALLLLALVPQAWAVIRGARLQYAMMTRTATLARRIWQVMDLATARDAAAEIRGSRAAPFVRAEHGRAADTLRDNEVALNNAQARVALVGRVLAGAGLLATYVALGLLLRTGWIPLSVAGASVIAIRTATAALTRFLGAANQLVAHGLYIADFNAVLADAAARVPSPAGRPAPAAPRRIQVDGVGFSYPGGTGPALRDVTLTVDAGQTVALVGENGSGKTTLAKIIAGLYRPAVGRIRWDGVDIAEYAPDSLADKVVMVLQDPVRWPHSARTNVRIGRHERVDPDDAALRAAAARSGADEVVDGLPHGWDTLLSSYFRGGVELSGGQWQRLAVARGLYRDGPLVIWDEPTAPLDARAEYAVYESLRRLAQDRTVILITHRLASIRHADRIFLLHHGELVEQGTHTELLAIDGRYAELYRLQAELAGIHYQSNDHSY